MKEMISKQNFLATQLQASPRTELDVNKFG